MAKSPVVKALNLAQTGASRPLVIDLDGTLIKSDLLIEGAFALLGRKPQAILEMIAALFRGKSALKHFIADEASFRPAELPYDETVLDLAKAAAAEGRPVYLASASNERLVEAVAKHLRFFTGWFASSETVNLSGKAKAERLSAEFGHQGFDYIGNDKADLAVWSCASQAVCVRVPAGVRRKLGSSHGDIRDLDAKKPGLKTWLRLFRVHQYAKNGLVLVPLLASHSFTLPAIANALLAVLAYSLCASAVYILNDLVDLAADRGHPTKRRRPLASGDIPLLHAIPAIPVLGGAGLLVAGAVSLPFLGVVLAYLALTTWYTFSLKRKMLVDVVALACLYSIRVLGGSVAIGVVLSPWLLAFSTFIFTSLALMKRYIELATRLDANLSDPTNRNYRISDLSVVMSLAAAAGFNAVTVLALYIASPDIHALYHRPEALWLVCPILMYWIGRALVMAHRRLIEDDPVIFAIKDRISRLAIVAVAIIAAIAI